MSGPTRDGRRRAYDRVGGTRLTGVGTVLVLVLVYTLYSPPTSVDREVLVLVWAASLTLLVLGVAWPAIAVRRISVTARAPRDAVVGERVPVTIELTGQFGPCEVRTLDPTGPWHRVSGPGAGTIEHLADRRGVYGYLRVEVRVTAPVGVAGSHRVHEVALPTAVEVAPRALAVDWKPALAPVDLGTDHRAAATLGGDVVRSVRPYEPGDPAHLVHWASTARIGSIVVRELEPPVPLGQAIVVDLTDLGADTERAAAYALGAARAVLAEGGHLVLCTAEPAGPVTGIVRYPIDANRRIARAVDGQPGTPPDGWPIVEIGR